MKGRPPKPTQLRAIEGNPGKRRLETQEPEPPVLNGDAPADLDGAALEKWNELYTPLVKTVGLSDLDRDKLQLYCESWQRMLQARDAIAQKEIDAATGKPRTILLSTYITHGRNGKQYKTRPEYHQIHEEVRLQNALGAELGLSPVARVRLRGVGQMELFDDRLAQLDSRYKGTGTAS